MEDAGSYLAILCLLLMVCFPLLHSNVSASRERAKMYTKLLSVRLVLALVCVAWLGNVAKAASILTQQSCEVNGSCPIFDINSLVPQFRSFIFNLPVPKTALVTFHGYLTCVNNSGSPDRRID